MSPETPKPSPADRPRTKKGKTPCEWVKEPYVKEKAINSYHPTCWRNCMCQRALNGKGHCSDRKHTARKK